MSIKEGIIPLAEVKAILEDEASQRELSAEQKYALEHAHRFSRLDDKKAKKLIGELMKEIDGLSEMLAVKIANLMPEDVEDLRVIFAKERSQSQKKDFEKILSIVEKYR